MVESTPRRLAPDLVNPRHQAISHPLFAGAPVFFDPRDLLQVRYELLRCHLIDGHAVVQVCREFGISRQTFYNLLSKFEAQGIPGLLPRTPGPKGPTKVTDQVFDFARQELSAQPGISGADLTAEVRSRLGIDIHKRTMERLLADLRSKKNG